MARTDNAGSATELFLQGGGETGELIRSIDWSRTILGPVTDWPLILKSTVGTLLHSRHPMFLWWGPELIQFYNDAYLPSFGVGKHPAAMGQPGRECWPEIWSIIYPQIEKVMHQGQASWNENHLVPIFRNGRIEEVYWTYGYSPILDERGAVCGTLVVCNETTIRVIMERRGKTVRALTKKTALATDSASVMQQAAEALRSNPEDIPFAAIYLFDKIGSAQLVEAVRLQDSLLQETEPLLRQQVVGRPYSSGSCRQSTPVSLDEPAYAVRIGPWPEPVSRVFVAPIVSANDEAPIGCVVYGLSARLPFDQNYREYLQQLTEHIMLAHARINAFLVRALAESERRSLLQQAPVATALMRGPQHIFELANPLYCKLVNRENLVGKTFAEALPELVDKPFAGILDRVYQTGEAFVTEEYLVALDRQGDGVLEDCFFRFNLEPTRDSTGNISGMMAIAVDITEQVRARRALERTHIEREKLLRELESASRAKDEFLAMLGHELRNPLSPIVTALQLMKMRSDKQTSKEQEVIERQVNHLVRLVDDLLDVSKITRGVVDLRKESIEIIRVIEKSVEIASVLFEQRHHQLVVDVPHSGLLWLGDPVRLAQIVANLLTNAARYTPAYGHIHLRAFREGSEVVITVKDNGGGISAEMLPRIFDLFVQGKRNTDRAEGGLGIGLTLVKNLVALHGGTVKAISQGVGQGSEFVIRLPLISDSQSTDTRTPQNSAPTSTTSSRRVLVVDDNVDAADLLGEVLRIAGHEVAVVYDPLSAMQTAEEFKPEIAVLDIGLPAMDGYELAARLRTILASQHCRMIALTGYGQQHDRSRSEEAGFESHMVKPIDFSKLTEIVAQR